MGIVLAAQLQDDYQELLFDFLRLNLTFAATQKLLKTLHFSRQVSELQMQQLVGLESFLL